GFEVAQTVSLRRVVSPRSELAEAFALRRAVMYCPSCGAADQKPDAYCRQCGLWLADPTSSRRHKSHTPSERMKVMAVFSGVNALFALISAIALYATYGGRPEAKWSVYVAANLCMVIAVHQTINFFFALGFRRKFKRDPARGDHAFGNKEQEAPLS